MPKEMFINPQEFLSGENINLGEIPSFTYKKSLGEEIEDQNLTIDDSYEILFQMKLIRKFETFLQDWKTTGQVNNKQVNFYGPAHFAIGQEACAVGQYFNATINDINMGTHRNHSEVIAKALSVINNTSEEKLLQIMKTYFDGDIYNVVNSISYENVKQQAKYFIMYGFLAEIMSKKTGVNKGLGGSMHMFFAPFGIFPNNAVVGGGIALALGSAMFKLQHQKPGIVVANIGDGGVATGPFWESLHFASMDQYKTLWKPPYNKYPPLMINISNNGYAMGGQTKGETMGYQSVARVASAFKVDNLHATRVNGNDVLAVIDMMKTQSEVLKNGKGPVLNEIVTYRISGHSSADAQPYRSVDEVEMWKHNADPIVMFENQMKQINIYNEEKVAKIEQEIEKLIEQITTWVIDENISPVLDFEHNEHVLDEYTLSNEAFTNFNLKDVEMLTSYEDNEHIKRLKNKERYAYDSNNKMYSPLKRYQIRDGIFEAVLEHMYKNPSLLVYGEEHRFWDGAYGVYRDLTKSAPPHRFFNTPIAEAAIVGSAIGYAMSGGQAIVEIMYFDFLWRCGDEVANQLGKWMAMSGGYLKIPLVIRFNIGYGYGAQHSQDLSALLHHLPGIKIVSPVTPLDAKGLMTSALNQQSPVMFIEVQELYDKGEEFVTSGVSEQTQIVEIGEPIIRKFGKDLTIITFGAQLYKAKEAIKMFAKYNIDVELIDLRSLVPLNYEILIKSVQKTGKVILANNGLERSNVMKDIASNLTRFCFDDLDAPPLVLGAKNTIMPSEEFVEYIYPSVDDYLNIYSQNIEKLPNLAKEKNHKDLDMISRRKKGV